VIKKGIIVFATVGENKKILLEEYKFPQENIGFLPISSDSGVYYYDEDAGNALKKDLKIQESDFVLLYTGKINERKKPHLLIEALKIIDKKVQTKIHAVFIGSAVEPYFSKYFCCKNIHGFNHIKIRFYPPVKNTELYKYYSMADIVVFPEENTLSALDAQLCRAPVIMASDTTNQERLLKGGLLFEKDDMNDLSEKILSLIHHVNIRQKLAMEGQKYIMEKYEYKNIVKKLEAYFIETMKN
jgi:glycosyltransferase involved in cell wall biosynthesis